MYTQGELIAMALDTEEGNIREHRDYLKNEEEKRKRARVVRTTISGPKLRWVSRLEEVKVPIPPPPTIPQHSTISLSSPSYRSVYGQPGTPFTYSYASGSLVKTSIPPATTSSLTQVATPNFTSPYQFQTSPFAIWPPNQQPYYPTTSTQSALSTSLPPSAEPTYQTFPATTSTTPLPTPINSNHPDQPIDSPAPEYKTEITTKNYLVHELAQHRGAPRPSWVDNMKALFGDHVKWEELKVFVGKNRPHCK